MSLKGDFSSHVELLALHTQLESLTLEPRSQGSGWESVRKLLPLLTNLRSLELLTSFFGKDRKDRVAPIEVPPSLTRIRTSGAVAGHRFALPHRRQRLFY